ncbi:GGDEF domain-containing protein [Ideonella sp. BN130291]|uniref:GGDEF domain-containing protein n=1 Tax=Ideonella sp. BN130291 TaxID=3112940 RepID=UPI002E273242|nr:GGDEF domain-containing protein [Ideonella sp. BN130291]
MDIHLPTLLLFSTALMLLAAGVMTVFGSVQRVYRGYWWWVSAQWLSCAGVALQAGLLPSSPAAVAMMHALLLQWPVITLVGLRRFHARQPLPSPAWVDAALLAAAYGAWALPWLMQAPLLARMAAFSLASAVLHAWVASRLLWAGSHRDSMALRAIGGFLGAVAGVQLGRAVYAAPAPAPAQALLLLQASGVLLAVTVSLITVYLTLLLTYERTERELRDSRRRLRYLANVDMLTRVPNRRRFQELARRVLERDPPGTAAVLMFDIDHFKRINDVLGHAAGDRALKLVSRCAQETLRACDVAGRHGGDEFVLLLPRTDVSDAMAVASRIAARVQMRTEPLGLPPLSLSFGVVQTLAGETLAEALHRADQALYEAKRQGRGRAVTAHGDEDQPVFGESRRLGLTPT